MSELEQVTNSGLPGDGTSDAEQQRVTRLLGDASAVAMPDDVFARIRGALSIEVQLRREGLDPEEVIAEAEQHPPGADQDADGDPDLDAELDRDLDELELSDGEDDLTSC